MSGKQSALAWLQVRQASTRWAADHVRNRRIGTT